MEQLEANLAELGYGGFTVDDEFTWYTAVAVREWQEDLGVTETGVVAASDVVFLPADGRVDTIHAQVGDTVTPGTAVLRHHRLRAGRHSGGRRCGPRSPGGRRSRHRGGPRR